MTNCFVLFGAPCSGKSTVGMMASEQLGMKYISSGDIAREMADYDKETMDNLKRGKMASEMLMRHEIKSRVQVLYDMGECFIIDGFPRNSEQVLWLREQFDDMNMVFIEIFAPISQITDRMIKRGRDGDDIRERLGYYVTQTLVDMEELSSHTINNDDNHDCDGSAEELVHIIKGVIGKDVNNSKTR